MSAVLAFAKRGRGRPKSTPEQKAAAAAAKEAAKSSNAAAEWSAKMPATAEERKEPFIILRSAEEKLKDSIEALKDKADIKGKQKRLTEVHGWHPLVLKLHKDLTKLADSGKQARVCRQAKRMIEDFGFNAQGDLLDAGEPGQSSEDQGSVFDGTRSGEQHAAERGDDPGRARKRGGKADQAPAPIDTGKLEPDEALKKLEEAKAAAAAKKAGKGGKGRAGKKEAAPAGGEAETAGATDQPAGETADTSSAASGEEEEQDLRPGALQRREQEREEREAEERRQADLVVAEQEADEPAGEYSLDAV